MKSNKEDNVTPQKNIDDIIKEEKGETSKKDIEENPYLRLTMCESLPEYLEILYGLKSKLLIIVSVKDNIGVSITKDISERWMQLGFITNIYPKGSLGTTYRAYIAALDGDNVLVESLGSQGREDINYHDSTFDIKSTVWKTGVGCGDISIKYKNADYAINNRGINFLVIDRLSDNIIDTVCFDTHIKDCRCNRVDYNLLLLNNEKKYEYIINKLKEKVHLGENNRVGVVTYEALGDQFCLLSAIVHAEKVMSKHFIYLYCASRYSDDNRRQMISWFNYDDVTIECYRLSAYEHWVLKSASQSVKQKYIDTLLVKGLSVELDSLVHVCGVRFGEEIRVPRFPHFDTQYYVNKYSIQTGKTILMIPLSNCCRSFPEYFWNFCAEIFRMIGFDVIFNVPEDQAKKYNGKNAFVPLSDIVGFANLCGHVFAVRTGLVDILSASTANMTIFSPTYFKPIDILFNIKNKDNHIKTIFYDNDDFFLEKTNPINLLHSFFKSYYSGSFDSISLVESLSEGSKKPMSPFKADAYKFAKPGHQVVKTSVYQMEPFVKSNYSFYVENNTLFFQLSHLDLQQYRLEIQLFLGGQNLLYLHDHKSLVVAFHPKKMGRYRISVIIADRINGNQQFFDTDELDFSYSVPKTAKMLSYCGGFEAYVKGLLSLSDDLVICISSRDAHTSAVPNNTVSKLHLLKAFGVQTDLVKAFRHSFLCVIDNGYVVQELSSETQKISEVYTLGDCSIEMSSEGYNVNKTNKCPIEIKINGTDYAVNKRGLNFVVWDKTLGRVVDSVCFDTYTNGAASRKEET